MTRLVICLYNGQALVPQTVRNNLFAAGILYDRRLFLTEKKARRNLFRVGSQDSAASNEYRFELLS